jgi:predicted neutral ceramidase superfamily lipid hydrolase
MRQFSQRFFPPMAGLLSLTLLWFAIGPLRDDPYLGSTYLSVLCIAILLGIAAIGVWLDWKGGRLLAFLSGVALCIIVTYAWILGIGFRAPALPILVSPVFLFMAVMAFALIGREPSDAEPTDHAN